MSDRDRWIDACHRRLRWGQYLARAGEWLAASLLVCGMAVLLVRRLRPEWWPQVLWLALLVAPAAAVAWMLTRRRAFTREESIAVLDRALGTGGLLMTLAEVPDEVWQERLPQLESAWRAALPRLRPQRFCAQLALPLLFAVGVCCVPLREIVSDDLPPPLTAGQRAAQRLEQMLAALQQAEALPPEQEAELEQEIRKLVEDTQRAPLTHEKWETVDALEQRLRGELSRAQFQIDRLTGAVDRLLQSAGAAGLELSEEQLADLEDELLETLMKVAPRTAAGQSGTEATDGGLEELVQRLTRQGTQSARLPSDPFARQQVLEELREFLQQESQRLAELRIQAGGGEAQPGQDGLPGADGQQAGGQQRDGEDGQGQNGQDQDGDPGQGGVNEGGGRSRLTWGDEADEQGVKFKQVALPPGQAEDPKAEVVGVQLTAPTVDPAAAGPRGAARDVAPTTGRETWSRRLRPRHQSVVKQFFQSGS